MLRVYITSLLSLILLVSCAAPVPVGNKAKYAEPLPGKAIVYVFNSISGLKISLEDLYVNGKDIGSARRGGYTWFYVSPGKTALSIHDPVIKTQIIAKTTFSAQAGNTYYFAHMLNGQVSTVSLGTAPGSVLASQHSGLFPVSSENGKPMIATHGLFGNTLTK